jgi:uncharacterized protein
LFPRAYYLWNVAKDEDITLNSLKLFEIISPPIDFLMIGTGDQMMYNEKNNEIIKYFKTKGITTELMSTVKKKNSFNLNFFLLSL